MIRLICVGKVKDKNLQNLIDDCAKRISRYHKLEIVEVKDEPIGDNEEAVKDKEGQRILEKIRPDEYVILLDLHGKSIDSVSLAKKIDQLFINSSKICFVIAGSLGFSNDVIARADERIRLSELTFLHQMTRLIILEQLYRCFKILNHETYHK